MPARPQISANATQLTIEDLLIWYEQFINDLEFSFRSSELDKQAVRDYLQAAQENATWEKAPSK
jgi:hypothetical protein